jgi:phenylpropionate dioxygenase-like ring-hydroxylating dioxygenase large terminal subunit
MSIESNVHPASAPMYDHDPAIAKTLPSEYYTSEEIFQKERRNIFLKSWVLAGYDSELRNPGDYVAVTIFDQPVVVVRDTDGVLRAFYNVCRHRGHLLVEGKGNTTRFRCPYHAWTYKLSGELGWAPNAENVPNFCAGNYPLAPIRVEIYARMVFVTLDPTAKSMADTFVGLREEIYRVIPRFDELYHARRDVIEIDANWKFIFDGLECYHCAYLHPGVLNSKDDYMTKEIHSIEHGRYQTHVFKGNRDVIDGRNGHQRPAWAEEKVDSYDLNLWYVWPNIMLMSHPGKSNLKVAHAWPIAPNKTIRIIDHFLTTPEPSELDLAQITRHREVFGQDITAMVSQQAGMRAEGFQQGRLMIDSSHSWQSEHSTHHFQGLIWDAVNAR